MSPERFWALSLRELWNEFQAATARAKREFDRDLILAWQIERLSIMAMQRDGGRKLPDIRKLLGDAGARRTQTREEQRAVIYALAASLGRPVQKVKRGADGQYRVVES